jgi:endonuclease YncB( thermonuclease family)
MEGGDSGSDIMKLINALFALLLISVASGAPDEAMGFVVNGSVIDGDTFNVSLYKHDSRISEDEIRVRLADIDCPEISGPEACEAGREAANYTKQWLSGKNVSLDLDDKSGKVLNFDIWRWILQSATWMARTSISSLLAPATPR